MRLQPRDEREWDLVLVPESNLLTLHLGELWRYRDLVVLLVRRDFVALYKQTILGPIWYFIQPLMTSGVMTVIFSRVAQIPTDGVPPLLFYLIGNVVWSYFSGCLVKTADTFIANAGVFGKVYFPRLVVPLSIVVVHVAQFLIQCIALTILYIYYWQSGALLNPIPEAFIFLPLLVLQMAALGMGVGTIVSSLTTRYRDLTYLVTFGVQLWMYATPVVYPASQIPARYRDLYMANPMAVVTESFRFILTGAGDVQLSHVLTGVGVTIFVLLTGVVMFNRVQRRFMDTI